MNLMCGFQVQELKEDVAFEKVNTRGCLPTIQNLIEANLYTVGGVAIGIALSQVRLPLHTLLIQIIYAIFHF